MHATAALAPDGSVVIATFPLDGPERCSGLPVRRRSAETLAAGLDGWLRAVDSRREVDRTPGGEEQAFTFAPRRASERPCALKQGETPRRAEVGAIAEHPAGFTLGCAAERRLHCRRCMTLSRTILIAITAIVALGACAPPRAPRIAAVHTERHATLLFFSDAHVDLLPHPELFWKPDGTKEVALAGGYARLAAASRAIREETGGRAVLVDGGDTFQGAGPAAWSRGDVVVEPQRALGVDVGVPGNWEVVYGAGTLESLARRLSYPLVAANIVAPDTGRPVFAPYVTREVGGLRVGFVGFTDPDTPTRQSPAYSRGLRFLESESLPPVIDALRAREHPDLVVLVTHVGLARSVRLAETLHGVDVILSGDTHERLYAPIVKNGVWLVEPGSFASFLGRLDVDVRAGEKPRFSWKLLELRADRYPEDAGVRAVVERALAPYVGRAKTVIGHAARPLERYRVVDNSADDVLTDALRSETGAEIALSNGFRFAHPIEAGPITEGDLWRLYPVATRVRVGEITGGQLRAFWESELEHVFASDPTKLFGGWVPRVSGMHVRFRADAPAGHRVTEILVGDAPLDDERTYRVAACEREGDPPDTLCRIAQARNVTTLDRDVHDVVRAYLARTPEVGASLTPRVVADDLPARVFSQYERR